MNHSARSGRKFRRNQRRLKSLAAQLPEFRQGRWVLAGAPEPAPDTGQADVLIAVRTLAPRAGRGSWDR